MNDPGQIRMFDVVWIMGIMDSGLLGIEKLPQINACINTMAAIMVIVIVCMISFVPPFVAGAMHMTLMVQVWLMMNTCPNVVI